MKFEVIAVRLSRLRVLAMEYGGALAQGANSAVKSVFHVLLYLLKLPVRFFKWCFNWRLSPILKDGFLRSFGYISGVAAFFLALSAIVFLNRASVLSLYKYVLVFVSNKDQPLSAVDMKTLSKLAARGFVTTPQEILGQLIMFYDTIITFLLGVIALSGIGAYVFIKTRTNEQARTMIKEEFHIFKDSLPFQQHLTAVITNLDEMVELRAELERRKDEEEAKNDFSEPLGDQVGGPAQRKEV